MAAKIRRNDEVIVLTGKDKGKKGKVKNIFSNGKAIVEGVNLVKKHQKPAPNMNLPGRIIQKESAIHLSNLAIFNSDSNKGDRVGFKFKDNQKVRIFKSNSKIIK